MTVSSPKRKCSVSDVRRCGSECIAVVGRNAAGKAAVHSRCSDICGINVRVADKAACCFCSEINTSSSVETRDDALSCGEFPKETFFVQGQSNCSSPLHWPRRHRIVEIRATRKLSSAIRLVKNLRSFVRSAANSSISLRNSLVGVGCWDRRCCAIGYQ